MTTVDESAVVETEKTPYGKVIGVVADRKQLQAVSSSLSQLGVNDVEVLEGAAGIKLLDKEQAGVSQYFLGDMEAEMAQRYLDAIKGGLMIFAAVVESEMADQVAATAKTQGASDVVHFGNWVITNY